MLLYLNKFTLDFYYYKKNLYHTEHRHTMNNTAN